MPSDQARAAGRTALSASGRPSAPAVEVPGVLWLHPKPDAPFRALTATLAAAYPQHPPYRVLPPVV